MKNEREKKKGTQHFTRLPDDHFLFFIYHFIHHHPTRELGPKILERSSIVQDISCPQFNPLQLSFNCFSFADKYEREARNYWDKFYKANKTNFFKDRRWICREFPELLAHKK